MAFAILGQLLIYLLLKAFIKNCRTLCAALDILRGLGMLIIFKLKVYVIYGRVIAFIQTFLSIIEMKVVLNGHSSRNTIAPTILRHKLFSVFINDIPKVFMYLCR